MANIEEMMEPREVVRALVSPEGRRNPYPLYERIRAHGNLVRVKRGLMVAVGYDECDQALREIQLRVQDGDSYDLIYPDWRSHSSLRGYINSMLYRNAPDHLRMRRLVSGAFTPRRVNALRPAVEQMTDRLLDRLAELGPGGAPVDFIAEFACRLPIVVISALLGVPENDQAWFRAVAADVTIALEGITSASRLASADTAIDELSEYFTALVEHRRRRPVDDMVSALAQARSAAGERLSRDELLGNMMLLLTAGFETTSFLLGHALLLALRYPEFGARLRDEPGFEVGYVEEVLRFEAPVQATSRWAATEVDLMSTTVPADTKVVVILGAGNRDPRRFSHADRFNPDRSDSAPLSFGVGAHFCLGAPLSRMEAQIALPRLLRRFPGIAAFGSPVRRDTWVGRGLERFPITLG
jgi:cytochrome P450